MSSAAPIRRPIRRFDLSRRRDFGSLRSRKRRDRRLAERIRDAAEQAGSTAVGELLWALAHRLSYADRGETTPRSRASYVGQGRIRHIIGSDVYRLAWRERRRGIEVSFVTLAFRGGASPPGELLNVDPRRWVKQLKSDLDRVRRKHRIKGPGWSLWFLDCDYLQVEGVLLFHWHGFATGSELKAIGKLRKLRKYHSPRPRPGMPRDLVRWRVRRTREPLYDIGYLALYMLKEEWPSQPSARNVPGNRGRSYPRPLPDDLRPMERLFFDRWSIGDISAVRGLRVINGHLRPSRCE